MPADPTLLSYRDDFDEVCETDHPAPGRAAIDSRDAIKGDRVMARSAILAIAALALAVGCASASAGAPQPQMLQPAEGLSIALGPINGVVYDSRAGEGDRVVATLAAGEGGTPLRVVVMLTPGQSLTLSVPRGPDEPAIEVALSRRGDRVFVSDPAAVTD